MDRGKTGWRTILQDGADKIRTGPAASDILMLVIAASDILKLVHAASDISMLVIATSDILNDHRRQRSLYIVSKISNDHRPPLYPKSFGCQ